jgi:hypothetical protein
MAAEVDRLFRHSVLANDVQEASQGVFYFVIPTYGGMYLVQNLPSEPPAYIPNSKERDAVLAVTPHVEGLWADAIRIATSRNTSKGYDFNGPSYEIERMQEMFDTCDGLNGFFQFLARHLRDYFTTDNGAWTEIERVSDSPGAEIVSFHHLDSLRCWRTGDPETPIYYQDILGKYHALRWYQCFNVVDMANPRAGYYNSGFCAASRAYRHIRKLAALDVYFDEKITGQGHTAIEFIQGVTYKQLETAAKTAESENKDKGVMYYMGKLIVPILSDQTVQRVSIPLKDVPDGFSREEEFRIAALNYAKAVGLPPHDLDPALVARGAMGVGAQTQIIEENIAGYGEGDWEKQFVKAFNRLIAPDRVTFAFSVDDVRDQQARANVAATRAGERAQRIASGEITVQQAQQLALDAGDLPRELAIGSDVTPEEQLSDEEKPEEVEGVSPLVSESEAPPATDALRLLAGEIRATRKALESFDERRRSS